MSAADRAWDGFSGSHAFATPAIPSHRDCFVAGYTEGLRAAHESPPPVEIDGDAAAYIRQLQERVAELEAERDEWRALACSA